MNVCVFIPAEDVNSGQKTMKLRMTENNHEDMLPHESECAGFDVRDTLFFSVLTF